MKTVLIVEDDLMNAKIFSKILQKRGGLDVKHTENVDEVMQIAQGGEADIILMALCFEQQKHVAAIIKDVVNQKI